jgi:hypothetical protein
MIQFRPALLATALLLAGCSDATGPSEEPLIGLFQLETVDGDALPAIVFDDHINDPQGGFQLRIELLEGTIEFYGDHEYEQVVERRGFANEEPIPLGRFIDRGTWLRGTGDEIILESSLYENRTTFGTRDGSVVVLEQDLSGEERAGSNRPHRFVEIESD